MFGMALYASKTQEGKPYWFFGLLIIFFASLVLLILRDNIPNGGVETARTVTIVCIALIAVGIVLIVISSIMNRKIMDRVCFAVFSNHLVICINVRSYRNPEYVKVPIKDIAGYMFVAHRSYDSEDTSRLFPDYHNYGILRLIVRSTDSKDWMYGVQIRNIIDARSWMQKLVPVPETLEKR